MADIHDALGQSIEQTRWMLKRVIDGENKLVANMLFHNPMQLLDVVICAATILEKIQKHHPEIIEPFFSSKLPN